jgi:hypothetical protein
MAISIVEQVSESLVGFCGLMLLDMVGVLWFSNDGRSGVIESVWKRRRKKKKKKNRERVGDLGTFI